VTPSDSGAFAARMVGVEEELMIIDPHAMESEFGIQYPWVALGIPGTRYREVETREALIEVAFGLAFLGLGAFVVGRRRPG